MRFFRFVSGLILEVLVECFGCFWFFVVVCIGIRFDLCYTDIVVCLEAFILKMGFLFGII